MIDQIIVACAQPLPRSHVFLRKYLSRDIENAEHAFKLRLWRPTSVANCSQLVDPSRTGPDAIHVWRRRNALRHTGPP